MAILNKLEGPAAVRRVPFWALVRKLSSYPVLLGALLVLATFVVTLAFRVDPDTWLHEVVGQRILSTHSWPKTDTYSFTAPGTGWMAYEWLADIALAQVMRMGGLRGWMGLLFGLASCLVLLIYYYAYLRCRNSKAACAATALVFPLAGVWFTLHPQLFGYVLLTITLICLEHFRQAMGAVAASAGVSVLGQYSWDLCFWFLCAGYLLAGRAGEYSRRELVGGSLAG